MDATANTNNSAAQHLPPLVFPPLTLGTPESSSQSTITTTTTFGTTAIIHTAPSTEVTGFLRKIWDCDMIVRDGKCWTCKWCKISFTPIHATRALCHVLSIRGNNITVCSSKITEPFLGRYQRLYAEHSDKAAQRKRYHEDAVEEIVEHQSTAAQKLLNKKHRGTVSISSATALSKPIQSWASRQPSISASLENAVGIRDANQALLQTAIADCFHSENIPDSVVDSKKFRIMIQLARLVGKDFVFPNRQSIGKELLDLNYQQVYDKNVEQLQKHASTFGLAFLGDGATIKKSPLINILAMCGSAVPPVTLQIKDCSAHMSSGGKKDASYIAELFEAKMSAIDPTHLWTDVIFFDGASNVQKAGRVLTVKFQHAYCFHAGEHVVSLFFASIAKLTPIKVCCVIL